MPMTDISRDVIDDVRAACERTGRPTTDEEVVRALSPLASDERETLRRLARSPVDAAPLGPDAWVEIARGVDADLASSREISGYYALKAERDALAVLAQKPRAARRVVGDDDDADDVAAPPDALDGERVKLRKPRKPHEKPAEVDVLLTLFAYHRDPVLVAQAMTIGLEELQERIESHGLRRRIQTLLERTTDIDVFSNAPRRKSAASGEEAKPVVRKAHEKRPARPVEEPAPAAWESEGPAARTDPVNAFGTRVFRRREAEVTNASTPIGAGRLEYVRETKKKTRVKPAAQKAEAPPRPAAAPVAPAAPAAPAKAPFAELQAPAGRLVLERLFADEKANPRVLVGKLGERYDGPGRPLVESDLRQLLRHHGLSSAFEEKELVNSRFLIGFHQGARGKLANALLMSSDEVQAYLSRIGLSADLEQTRAERARQELGKKRFADRVAQVLTRAPYLEDLGILPAIDAEVRREVENAIAQARVASSADVDATARAALGVDTKAFAKLRKRYEV